MKKTIILTLTIAVLSAFTYEKNQDTTTANGGYKIGDIATDFALPSTDGQIVSMSQYPDAKGFIVVFTCNHCPYAQKYEKRIMDLDIKFADKGYPVIAINPNDPDIEPEDDMEHMKELAEEKGYTFPYLMDTEQEVYPVYGATKTPHVFILKKESKGLVVNYIGAIDNNYRSAEEATQRYVEDAVNALLKGRPIKVTESKAIGCSIKDKRNG